MAYQDKSIKRKQRALTLCQSALQVFIGNFPGMGYCPKHQGAKLTLILLRMLSADAFLVNKVKMF